MAKKKSAQFKRFASAMSKIVTVSKDELAKREAADKQRRAALKLQAADAEAIAQLGEVYGDSEDRPARRPINK